MKTAPQFFAGRLYTEDDQGTFTLEIFHVHPTQEGDDQDWDWELGRRAETRVFHWHREPDPNFPKLDRIIYNPKENA